jgi:hypothetical protein
MSVAPRTKHRYKVGDRIRLRLGARVVAGGVVEDLGYIGVDGEQLVRVEVRLDATYRQVFEVRAASLTLLSPRRRAAA